MKVLRRKERLAAYKEYERAVKNLRARGYRKGVKIDLGEMSLSRKERDKMDLRKIRSLTKRISKIKDIEEYAKPSLKWNELYRKDQQAIENFIKSMRSWTSTLTDTNAELVFITEWFAKLTIEKKIAFIKAIDEDPDATVWAMMYSSGVYEKVNLEDNEAAEKLGLNTKSDLRFIEKITQKAEQFGYKRVTQRNVDYLMKGSNYLSHWNRIDEIRRKKGEVYISNRDLYKMLMGKYENPQYEDIVTEFHMVYASFDPNDAMIYNN